MVTDRLKVTKKDAPELVALAMTAFPDYRGRKFRVEVTDQPLRCNDTWWDGGSRSEYVFVNLSVGSIRELPDMISGGFLPGADAAHKALGSVNMPEGFACVRHSIFCGKDMGLLVFLRPADVNPRLLPFQLMLAAK